MISSNDQTTNLSSVLLSHLLSKNYMGEEKNIKKLETDYNLFQILNIV